VFRCIRPNFSHGRQNLSMIFFILNLLAFYVHQILEPVALHLPHPGVPGLRTHARLHPAPSRDNASIDTANNFTDGALSRGKSSTGCCCLLSDFTSLQSQNLSSVIAKTVRLNEKLDLNRRFLAVIPTVEPSPGIVAHSMSRLQTWLRLRVVGIAGKSGILSFSILRGCGLMVYTLQVFPGDRWIVSECSNAGH